MCACGSRPFISYTLPCFIFGACFCFVLTACGVNCHKKCEGLMGNLCGVNQKLLSDALVAIKDKGKIPSLDPVCIAVSTAAFELRFCLLKSGSAEAVMTTNLDLSGSTNLSFKIRFFLISTSQGNRVRSHSGCNSYFRIAFLAASYAV